MMQRLASILMLTLLPALAHPAALQVFINVSPSYVAENGSGSVEVLVRNGGAVQANNVQSTLAAAQGVSITGGPLPAAPQTLLAGGSAAFTYTFLAQSCGTGVFTANASGEEEGTGSPLSGEDQVFSVNVNCPTPTPTATPTPWIIYETATPAPKEAWARVLGNVLRPGSGPAQLEFSIPEESKVTIRIYDRTGRLVRTLERDAPAGRWIQTWDGRTDGGDRASSGIYAVHFQGKGLNKTVKIAVVK